MRAATGIVFSICWVVSVLLSAVTAPATALAQKTLRWKFEPDQKLAVTLQQQIETESTISNKPIKMSIEVLMEMHWDVGTIETSGAANVSQTFHRIVLKMNVPPQAMVEFDSLSSKKPTGDAKELAALVTPLIGVKLQSQISPLGEILSVQISEDAVQALANAGGISGSSFFTKERISQLLRQSAAVLPEQPVAAGEKWEGATTLDSPLGKLRQTSTFTYVGEELRDGTPLEKIAVVGKIELPAAVAGATGPELKDQSLTGTILFDNKAGRMAESRIVQKMRTETKVRENVVAATATNTLHTVIALRP